MTFAIPHLWFGMTVWMGMYCLFECNEKSQTPAKVSITFRHCQKVENSKEVMVLNSDFKFMLCKKIPSYDSIAEFLLLA